MKRLFDDFEVAPQKLAIGRVVLFGLLALDALLQIPHAPRYGTGFNVAQLPLLDNLGPGRVAYLAGELALAYLFVMAACNVATRIVLPCAAAIYAWLYFGSQLDSYQHHYLIALVLGIACFIPWEPGDGKPVRAWAMRLFLVQLAVMYLWAAISKLDGQWLGGDALASQLGSATLPADRVSVVAKIVEHTIGWAATAWLVVLTEFALACTVWIRRAAVVAAPLGIALHAGIVLTGLEIGLFAWLMIAMYAFVVPDRVWVAIARLVPRVPALPRWTAAFGVVGVVLAATCRFDHALAVGIVLAIATAALVLRERRLLAPAACAYATAMLLWFAVDRESTVAVDYYKLWGGSARRLRDLDASERAYRGWIAIEPDDANAHFRLGRVLVERGDKTAGVAELRTAAQLGSSEARALLQGKPVE